MEGEFLAQYGILGAFNTICMMYGEKVALAYGRVAAGEADEEVEVEALDGISYLEFQLASEQLAVQLYHRFGVRQGDKVLLVCRNCHGAEITAMLSCLRLSAIYVPVDTTATETGIEEDHLAFIIEAFHPVAAVVVASNDSDPIVRFLASQNVFRCALVNTFGQTISAEFSSEDYSDELPEQSEVDTEDINGDNSIENLTRARYVQPLYILFTSGSSGRPKGVVGTHAGLVSRLLWQQRCLPWAREDPFLSNESDDEIDSVSQTCVPHPPELICRRTPLVFVDAQSEIFSALLFGIPLWSPNGQQMDKNIDSDRELPMEVPTDAIRRVGLASVALVAAEMRVTRITVLPSQLKQLLQYLPDIATRWNSLKVVTVSGEPCSKSLVQLFHECLPETKLVNLYGSTEMSGDVTFAIFETEEQFLRVGASNGQLAPIGQVMEDNLLFIGEVDEEHVTGVAKALTVRLVDDGIPGELFVAGRHVALGYFENPIETAKRFFSFEAQTDANEVNLSSVDSNLSQRVFRTGDVVVRDGIGELTWLGRRDNQMKIRGVRVELESVQALIESKLQTILSKLDSPASPEVAAIAVAEDVNGSSSSNHIFLFAEEYTLHECCRGVPTSALEPNIAQDWTNPNRHITETRWLHQHLAATLPSAFVPSVILTVPTLPRTTTGKKDFAALRNQVLGLLREEGLEDQMLTKKPKYERVEQESIIDSSPQQILQTILSEALPFWALHCKEKGSSIDLSNITFFDIGGDSMTAIEFMWKVRQRLGLELDMISLQRLKLQEIFDENKSLPYPSTIHKNRLNDAAGLDDILKREESASIPNPVIHSHEDATRLQTIRPQGDRRSIVLDYLLEKNSGIIGHDQNAVKRKLSCVDHWSVQLLRCVDASPLWVDFAKEGCSSCPVLDSVVYIGCHGGRLCAVSMNSKQVIWSLQLTGHIEGAAGLCRREMLLFVPSYQQNDVDGQRSDETKRGDGKESTLWAVDAVRGTVVACLGISGLIKSSILIDSKNRCCYFGSYDGNIYVVSYLPEEDGSSTVQLVVRQYIDAGGGSVFATPIRLESVSTGCNEYDLITVTNRGVLSRLAVGSAGLSLIQRVDLEVPVFATPVIGKSHNSTPSSDMIIIACVDGSVRGLLSQSLEPIWTTYADRPIFATPSFRGNIDGCPVCWFGSHDSTIRAIKLACENEYEAGEQEIKRASLLWAERLDTAVYASPQYLEIPLKSSSARDGNCEETTITNILRLLVVATIGGTLYVLNAIDGSKVYETKLEAEIFSSPLAVFQDSPDSAQGSSEAHETINLLFGCRDNRLHCVKLLVQ